MNQLTAVLLAFGLCLVPLAVNAGEETAVVVPAAIEVGNTICPVSGEKIGQMGEVIKLEHKGKIYNFCCGMCAKDFNKDPDKYVKIAEDEVKANQAAEVKN